MSCDHHETVEVKWVDDDYGGCWAITYEPATEMHRADGMCSSCHEPVYATIDAYEAAPLAYLRFYRQLYAAWLAGGLTAELPKELRSDLLDEDLLTHDYRKIVHGMIVRGDLAAEWLQVRSGK